MHRMNKLFVPPVAVNVPEYRLDYWGRYEDPLESISNELGAYWAKPMPMQYTGQVTDVLSDLRSHLAEPSFEGVKDKFWHPSLVLRAIIDSSVDGPERIELVNAAASFGLDFYGERDTTDSFDRLVGLVEAAGLEQATVSQQQDNNSLESSVWRRAMSVALYLTEIIPEDEPLFVMPICHGGFIAGLRVALEYKRQRPEADIRVYPARLSTYKNADKEPSLTPGEVDYVTELATGRTIVVADEDATSGTSVQNGVRYMKSHFPRSTVWGVVCRDVRRKTMRVADYQRRQGSNWERRQLTLRTLPTAIASFARGR